MESLTLIPTQNRDWRYHREDWMFLDIPKGFGTLMVLPQWDEGWENGPWMDMLDDYGHLALYCAEAKQVLEDFDEYVKEHTEWKDVSFKFAMLGTRPIDHHLPWHLAYYLYAPWGFEDDSEYEESDVDLGYGESHWHIEAIDVEGGDLGSCRRLEQTVKGHRYFVCREQRWLKSNDAFWLPQNDQTSLDSMDEYSEFSSESSEDEPEEDLEETTDDESDSDAT